MDPKQRTTGTGHVDYSLARRATLRSFRAGRLSRFEICDAHPDLVRAARFAGQKTNDMCPICDRGPVVLVKYVFSDEFSKRENGQVWTHDDIAPLLKLREARVYSVEVCPDCSWNHLRSQLMLSNGRARQRRGRRAST
jgi:hypothetical protein